MKKWFVEKQSFQNRKAIAYGPPYRVTYIKRTNK